MMDLATLAELVAAHLNAVPDAEKPFAYLAARPKTKAEVIAETTGWRVWVVPASEDETPLDRSDVCSEQLRVRLIVNGPCADVKIGLRAAKRLRRLLRESEFADPDPEPGDVAPLYSFQGAQSVSIYDDQAIERGQFLATFEVEYYGVD